MGSEREVNAQLQENLEGISREIAEKDALIERVTEQFRVFQTDSITIRDRVRAVFTMQPHHYFHPDLACLPSLFSNANLMCLINVVNQFHSSKMNAIDPQIFKHSWM
jgi:hypothetical protein